MKLAYVAGGFLALSLMWVIRRLVIRLFVKAGIEGGNINKGAPESRRAIVQRQADSIGRLAPVAIGCAVAGLVLALITLARD